MLAEIGGARQQKLKSVRVLVVGAGGLGAPCIIYLAAAGVGTIGIVDDDRVSLSNLQRQIIHDIAAVGRAKVESDRDTISRINPHVAIEPHNIRLDADTAADLMSDYDVVVDGSDNFATRYLVTDICADLHCPLVTAAVGRFDGSITTLKPYETGLDGSANPTFRCFFPEAPPDGLLPTCAEAGILGALTGVVSTMQALEVIKLVVGVGERLIGRLVLYDALAMRFETNRHRRRSGAPE